MRSVLEEFAYGNLLPDVRFFLPGSAYAKAMQRLADCEETLLGEMAEGKKDLVTALSDAQATVSLLSGTDRFVRGYKLGVLMTMEVFSGAGDLFAGSEDCDG